jgi:hypothetical protein
MIRFQIVERAGADLHRALVRAMRSGELRTFVAEKRGRKVVHKNPSIPGWMSWSSSGGVIHCEVRSPRKPGAEWRLFSAFLGRLADRYSDRIVSISVQFPEALPARAKAARRKRPRRR